MAETGVQREVLTYRTLARGVRQDDADAMGSDIVRAIIEFVTNSDDAYERLGRARREKITVEVIRRRGASSIVRVKDFAGGMTADEMKQKLNEAGGRTSGFESGQAVRGLLGRGAKDTAHFGPVSWMSQKNRATSRYSIDPQDRLHPVLEHRLPSDPGFGRRDGTVVELQVDSRFSVGKHETLLESLRRHYALRPMLRDRPGREIRLSDGKCAEKIVYHEPRGELLLENAPLPICGNWPGGATLTLALAPESLDDGRGRERWNHSVLIADGRAGHDVFDGGRFARGADQMHLRRLFGTINVPAIGGLMRAYDDAEEAQAEHPASNPTPIITRGRRGLVGRSDHPFVDALYAALENAIEPFIDRLRKEEEAKARPQQSKDLQRRLRAVGKLFDSEMARDEEEDFRRSAGDGGGTAEGLRLIPSSRVVPPDVGASLTVSWHRDADPSEAVADVDLIDEQGNRVPQRLALERRSDHFSSALRVSGRTDGSRTHISASVGADTAWGEVEWRVRDVEPATELMFDRNEYSIRDGGQRRVLLLAPWDDIANGVAAPEIGIQTPDGPGIVITSQDREFKYDEQRDAGVLTIRLEGNGIWATADLNARLGLATATATATVTRPAASQIKIEGKEFDPAYRAMFDRANGTLFYNTAHPLVQRYLRQGQNDDYESESPLFRSLLAEILVAAFTRERLQQRTERIGPSDLFADYEARMSRLLVSVHKTLVPDAETRT